MKQHFPVHFPSPWISTYTDSPQLCYLRETIPITHSTSPCFSSDILLKLAWIQSAFVRNNFICIEKKMSAFLLFCSTNNGFFPFPNFSRLILFNCNIWPGWMSGFFGKSFKPQQSRLFPSCPPKSCHIIKVPHQLLFLRDVSTTFILFKYLSFSLSSNRTMELLFYFDHLLKHKLVVMNCSCFPVPLFLIEFP
jgi:hypothetical protein